MSNCDQLWPLYDRAKTGCQKSAISLFFLKDFHKKGYHGAGWAAEAVSTNPTMKTFLFNYIKENISKPEVLIGLYNLVLDHNCNGHYYTPEEYQELRSILNQNWTTFTQYVKQIIEDNRAMVYQLQLVICDEDYIEDGIFSKEQVNEMKVIYNWGISSILDKID